MAARKCYTFALLCVISAMLMVWSVNGCTVDGGEFFQIISVDEELPIGKEIGRLTLDNPSEIRKLSIIEVNPYINLVLDDDGKGATFTVARRIDTDTGLNRLQTMVIECVKLNSLKLEIEMEFEISDTNDHSPVFRPTNLYNFSMSETAPAGTQVGVIKANDGDIKNSYVLYELIDPQSSSNFELRTIGNGGASITLVNSLDYETQNLYTLQIVAKDCQVRRDCGYKQRSSTATVIITVQNEDDLNPQFDQSHYQVSLSQDANDGDFVAQVTAYDQDNLQEAIEYTLSGAGKEYFTLEPVTGKLMVTDSTTLTAGEVFTFQVKAAQKSDTAKFDLAAVRITIISADWDKPKFTERAYVTSVTEYGVVNSTLLSVAINYNLQRDPLVVQLVETDDPSPFRIEHFGNNVDLILKEVVDYEKQKVYHLTIRAANGEHADEIEVTVNILNENDNNPVFDQDTYSFSTLFTGNRIVGTVRADDADSSDEAIKYSLLPSEVSSLFAINASGCLTLTSDETQYTRDSYTLVVEASDSGKPARSSNVVITVSIIDSKAAAMTVTDKVQDSNNDIIGYIIIGSATLVIASLIGLLAYLINRKIQARNLRKQRNELSNHGNSSDDPTFAPLCAQRHRDNSSLGLTSIVNGRHENTYRNMSELSRDEKYRTWKTSNSTLAEQSENLLNQSLCEPTENSTSSDSGHSSGDGYMSPHTHHRSQSDPEATRSSDRSCFSPNCSKKGFISAYLEEHKKRHSGTIQSTIGNSFPEAPEQFRSFNSSRPVSITESTHSHYAASNTSDYGSNTGNCETAYHGIKGQPLIDSFSKRGHNSSEPNMKQSISESGKPSDVIIIQSSPSTHSRVAADALTESAHKKPFTTFHGDFHGDLV